MGSIFDSMDKPGTSSRPGFLDAGDFDVTITGVRSKSSQDPTRPRGTVAIIVDMLVASSTNPAIPVGSPRAWVVTVEPNTDQGEKNLADVKCFLFACLGTDPQDKAAVTAREAELAAKGAKVSALFEQMTGEKNPLAGTRVHVSCKVIRTRSGGSFTQHTWTPARAEG